MALSASLSLDIKKFEAGLDKAAVELQVFERATKNTNRDLKRLMEDFSGQKIAVEAARAAEAVKRIGGASMLTETEQKRVNATVTEAIAKYQALGQTAPAHLIALQNATAGTAAKTSTLLGTVGQLAAAFSVAGLIQKGASALIGFGAAAVHGAGEMVDLSHATGVSLGRLQEWTHVAEQGGVQLEDMTKASFKLGAAMDGGGSSVREAVARLGLAFDTLRALKPEDQMDAILRKAEQLGPEQERNAILVDLFGSRGAQSLARVVDGYAETANAASKAGDAQVKALSAAGDAWDKWKRDASNALTQVLGNLAMFAAGSDPYKKVLDAGLPSSDGKRTADINLGGPTSAARDYTAALAKMRAEIAAVVKAHGAELDAAVKLGASTEEITRAFGLSEEAQRLYASTTKDASSEISKAAAAEQRANDKRAEANKQFRESIKYLDLYRGGYYAVVTAVEDAQQAIDEVRQSMEAMSAIRFNTDLVPFVKGVTQQSSLLKQTAYDAKQTAASLRDLASAMADLSQVGGSSDLGKIAEVISAMSVGAEAGSQMRDAMDKIKAGGKSAAAGLIQMATAATTLAVALEKVTRSSSKTQNVLGGLATGASAGSAFGPWGTAIGAAVGGLVGLFRGTQKAAKDVTTTIMDWPKLLADATDASGHLSAAMRATVQQMVAAGTATQEIKDFLKSQGASALEGFNAVAKDGETTWAAYGEAVKKATESGDQSALTAALTAQHAAAERAGRSLKDLGIQAVASFNAGLASGMSFTEALQAAQPGLQSIIHAYASLGLNVDDAALKVLTLQSSMLAKNPELLAGVDGLAQGFVALSNLGLLNADTFASMQRTAMDMFSRIQGEMAAAGADISTNVDALRPMQKYLQEAAAAAMEFGLPLDENTQMLIDQSKELGLWKDKGKPPMEEMRDAVIEMKDAILEMVGAMGKIPAKVTTEVMTKYTSTGNRPDGGPTNTTQPIGPPVDVGAAQRATMSTSSTVTLRSPVYLEGRQIAESVVAFIPDALRRRGAAVATWP